MDSLPQYVKKAEYARMHGWARSYVHKLAGSGRLVVSSDGTLVDWHASDALIGRTSDPSKLGVQQRWAEARGKRETFEGAGTTGDETAGSPAAPLANANVAADSPFHVARATKEYYNGEMARLEYEWITGLLVSRPRVEDAAHTIGRALRDRVLGMAPRVAPELAAITDPWELEKRLTAALRQVLDDVAAVGAKIMRDVTNDVACGKLSELAREGKERYGTDREEVPAP